MIKKPENRTVPVGLRFTPTMKKALDKAAADNHRPVASVIEKVLIEWLAKSRLSKAVGSPCLLPRRSRLKSPMTQRRYKFSRKSARLEAPKGAHQILQRLPAENDRIRYLVSSLEHEDCKVIVVATWLSGRCHLSAEIHNGRDAKATV